MVLVLSAVRGIIGGMCKDDRSALRCPSCHASLVLAATGGGPPPGLALRDPPYPPPVHEVLAEYAGRAIDPATARSGAAQVRASLAAARSTAAERRARQAEARHAVPGVRGVPHRAA
ncbi:hypothetical protein NE236_00920 [Actinoallomurus purpureus]|uniref:hypothetical protein n=1 Tax=Actinoallomurus purpureus TaxID=478114 RepID=UPI002094009B|nr:hypothetical protein [Actinoallomurus purpureus]MCO6003539.1 hypothetical protein [Actinoallomurus purpureus]